jgi:hypothetical protein
MIIFFGIAFASKKTFFFGFQKLPVLKPKRFFKKWGLSPHCENKPARTCFPKPFSRIALEKRLQRILHFSLESLHLQGQKKKQKGKSNAFPPFTGFFGYLQ